MKTFEIKGNIVDIFTRNIYFGTVQVVGEKIQSITPDTDSAIRSELPNILPGFVDSHIHIESSLLTPNRFAEMAVLHGTVGTVSDPHEIANVCGIAGVEFMIENARSVNFKFNFGAPSCVPATVFETAGAELDSKAIATLLARADIKYLSEVMNFPAVIAKEKTLLKKIAAAHFYQKPIDGHAPLLTGKALENYIAEGISTDHESVSKAEATEKLEKGMKIWIREGSAAKNFDALIDLLAIYPEKIAFCSDDKHPDSLLEDGHINRLCARAVAGGIPLFNVLRAACVNPVFHYNLDIGLLRKGDKADFILVKNLSHFEVLSTYINGKKVADRGESLLSYQPALPINHFDCSAIKPADLTISFQDYPYTDKGIPMIKALDGQLITERINDLPLVENQAWKADIAKDILKIVVVNRYTKAAPIAKAFIKNFGLKSGAIASSVAHDSHNIVAVGVDDESIARAINLIITEKGGLAAVDGAEEALLPLPIAGLMSDVDGKKVAVDYIALNRMVKEQMKSTLAAPFMTLSFMSLLVIPSIKLSDKGLFDGERFEFVKTENG